MKIQLIPVAMFFVACSVFARPWPAFDQVDINADGVLSQKEITSVLAGLDFSKADKDGDGGLSKEEYAQVIKERSKDTGASG